jgi:hypothetical protein
LQEEKNTCRSCSRTETEQKPQATGDQIILDKNAIPKPSTLTDIHGPPKCETVGDAPSAMQALDLEVKLVHKSLVNRVRDLAHKAFLHHTVTSGAVVQVSMVLAHLRGMRLASITCALVVVHLCGTTVIT